MRARPRILFISADESTAEGFASKLPDRERISVCGYSSDELYHTLNDILPHNIYLFVGKSDQILKKTLLILSEYILKRKKRITVVGKGSQARLVAAFIASRSGMMIKMIGYDDLTTDIYEYRTAYKRGRAKLPGRPVIMLVSDDIDILSGCESVLREKGSAMPDCIILASSFNDKLLGHLKASRVFPDAAVFSDDAGSESTAEFIRSFYSLSGSGDTPFILLDTGYAADTARLLFPLRPYAVLSLSSQLKLLAQTAEKMMKQTGSFKVTQEKKIRKKRKTEEDMKKDG